jgi:hypothetical protein
LAQAADSAGFAGRTPLAPLLRSSEPGHGLQPNTFELAAMH